MYPNGLIKKSVHLCLLIMSQISNNIARKELMRADIQQNTYKTITLKVKS